MKISINGLQTDVTMQSLEAVLLETGYGDMRVATAVNGSFVSVVQRKEYEIEAGDQLEVVAPQQGG